MIWALAFVGVIALLGIAAVVIAALLPDQNDKREKILLEATIFYWVCTRLQMPNDEVFQTLSILMRLNAKSWESVRNSLEKENSYDALCPLLIFAVWNQRGLLPMNKDSKSMSGTLKMVAEQAHLYKQMKIEWAGKLIDLEVERGPTFDRNKWASVIEGYVRNAKSSR